ncbi:MAG: FAD-dependent oxidoreductase [Candidatus Omnitrophica bacterium]|nr:FAD-dependent oxidoreductase [Candidatus Omnitrophota bacterium]
MSTEIVIIGGGLSGLVLGYFLAKEKYKCIIIEKEDRLGGLSAVYRVDNFFIEYFYHYFLARDKHIIRLLDELNLSSEVIWQKVKVGLLSFRGKEFLGYASNQRIRTYSTGWDFLTNEDFGIKDKYLLGRLYSAIFSLKDIREIENITAKDWIIAITNKRIYERIFEPILFTKWGKERDRISASWLVARLGARLDFKKYFKSNEYVGYPRASFEKVFSKLEQEIVSAGSTILRKTEVIELRHKNQKIEEVVYVSESKKKAIATNCVINTTALPILMKIVSLPDKIAEECGRIEYQHVICACLGLKKSLTKVLNVVCPPGTNLFNGLVEHTNIVPRKLYNNQSIVYLFKYLNTKTDEWNWTDEEIVDKWTEGLKVLFPAFRENDLLWKRVSRTEFGDPLSILNYSQIMPSGLSPIKGLFLTGLCRIPYVQDCNNLIRLAQKDVVELKNHLESK